MNQIKSILIRFLQWCFKSPVVFLKVKDIIFTNPAEHLHRSVKYISSKKILNGKDKFLILDIGASNGNTAKYFSKNFPECTIIGFEPIKDIAKFAAENCSSLKNIHIRNYALGKIIEKRNFYVTSDKLSSSFYDVEWKHLEKTNKNHQNKFQVQEVAEVDCTTLDNEFQSEKILLIKIDTQGSELDILEGGKTILNSTHFILIELSTHELYKGGCSYFQVDSFLRENGFCLVDIYVTYRPKGKLAEYDALYEKIIR
jgi:FkbM family methyltransferase